MENKYTPWDVGTELTSPNHSQKLTYQEFGEVAMGGPISGTYFLIENDKSLKITESCGGPAVWEKDGWFVAIPIWKHSSSLGLHQQIAVLNTRTKDLTIFQKAFKVIQLESFERNLVTGVDSPIYKPKLIHLDIYKEVVSKIIRLT